MNHRIQQQKSANDSSFPFCRRGTRLINILLAGVLAAWLMCGVSLGDDAVSIKCQAAEPDLQTALSWWPEQQDKWTAVGWKDHMFRFNVLHNGTIWAETNNSARTSQWAGQGVQIAFSLALQRDDGSVRQGWNECAAPVLWTEWSKEGFLIRQEMFAHIPGGGDTVTGIEPLYGWIRVSVYDACPSLPLEDNIGFAIQINAPCIAVSMAKGCTLIYNPNQSQYPRALAADRQAYDPAAGYRIVENDGKIRLGVAPELPCNTSFQAKTPTEKDSLMWIQLPAKVGAHVDILLPMLPADQDAFDTELALGFDGALAEANRYWSIIPETAATLDCPEDYLSRCTTQNLKSAEIIAERNPATGITSMLTGSWQYTAVWSTPNSIAQIMLLDTMGYHSTLDKYLAVFKSEQGTMVPPGSSYKLHPGYLSTPQSLRAVNWLTDHGAILWVIAEHVMLAGGKERIEEWTPAIIKACEFIRDARAIKGHGGAEGIMPPAVSTDIGAEVQAVWADGWTYKGLTTAVRFLKRIHHPRAAEFEAEARDYQAAFQKAFREKAVSASRWTDSQGREYSFPPVSISQESKGYVRHAFSLDQGALFLVFSGLMDADDELMKATLLWFREGPQTKFYRRDSDCFQVPCLDHEISSCQVCYSWNVFHPWQTGDRAKFLEGMYSMFVGGFSQQTYEMCESRGGMSALVPCMPSTYLARLAVIDDQIQEEQLHLLRLMPLSWLRTDRQFRFENVPTEFGPVSVRAQLEKTGEQDYGLQVSFQPEFRLAPGRIVLHVPPVAGLSSIHLNGKKLMWNGKKQSLEIGQP